VASDQPLTFYQAVSSNRAWFESWINAGGIFEFHGAAKLSEDWSSLPQPGNFNMAYFSTDEVSPANLEMGLFKRPNLITDAELDSWKSSVHGYFVDFPAGSKELLYHDPEQQPSALKFDLGQGCVLTTLQPLEWAWDHEYSRLLENYISYNDCSANYHLYLSLALNNAP